jgi:ElaB/YqjD/DUF883 family membrane-anchored ribosome-binding protein
MAGGFRNLAIAGRTCSLAVHVGKGFDHGPVGMGVMKTSNLQVDEDIKALQSDIRRLRDDLIQTVNSVRFRGRNTVMDTRNRVRGMMTDLQDRARQRLREQSEAIKDRGREVADRYRSRLQHRPLTALLTAFTIGAIVALVFLRRRD